MRIAIRDALYRTSRKPFQWGGLQCYQQLQVIAEHLQALCTAEPNHAYWHQLSCQVQRTLNKNRASATHLAEAHQWLLRIASCLGYLPSNEADQAINGQLVAQEMELLLLQPDPKYQRSQRTLCSRLQYLWKWYEEQLLTCYDIPGLLPDNLQLEAFFNRLRRHQRRISGRKTTRELNRLGHYQALFTVESETEFMEHLRQVPYKTYHDQRQNVHLAEAHQRFLHGLHHDPVITLKKLVTHRIAQKQTTDRNPCEDEHKDP